MRRMGYILSLVSWPTCWKAARTFVFLSLLDVKAKADLYIGTRGPKKKIGECDLRLIGEL